MCKNNPRLTLTLPSDLRMLSVARAFVEAAAQASGLDRPTVHAVVLATMEAVSNIVRHAHHNRPEAQVQIESRLHPDAFEIALHDEGEPFDITAVPHLDPEELRDGGRGVFMMRALMDELTCHRRGDRGNILRMVKRRPSPGAVRGCS
jgi:serine/threonine-protein kinase RsbW